MICTRVIGLWMCIDYIKALECVYIRKFAGLTGNAHGHVTTPCSSPSALPLHQALPSHPQSYRSLQQATFPKQP